MEFFFVATEDEAIYTEWNEQNAPAPCPDCGRSTEPDPAAGYDIRVADASALKDLNHAAPVYVASSRFVEWYGGSGLTGLEFDPLAEPSGHARAKIVGSARLDPSSGPTVEERCETCGYRYYAVAGPWVIDQQAWDQNSFFQPEERRGAMFCSEPAMNALEASGLAGPVFLEMDLVAL